DPRPHLLRVLVAVGREVPEPDHATIVAFGVVREHCDLTPLPGPRLLDEIPEKRRLRHRQEWEGLVVVLRVISLFHHGPPFTTTLNNTIEQLFIVINHQVGFSRASRTPTASWGIARRFIAPRSDRSPGRSAARTNGTVADGVNYSQRALVDRGTLGVGSSAMGGGPMQPESGDSVDELVEWAEVSGGDMLGGRSDFKPVEEVFP